MAIDRTELYEGGKAFVKAGFNGGHAMQLRSVTVLSIERAACRVRFDNGKEKVVRFNEMEADDEFIAQRDRAEEAKKERIRREALAIPSAPVRGMRLVPDSRPLTTLGEVLAAKHQTITVPTETPSMPPSSPPPPAPPPVSDEPAPAPPAPAAEVVQDVPAPAAPKKKSKVGERTLANAKFVKSGADLVSLREKARLTRKQAAEKLKMAYQSLYSWEKGVTRPNGDSAKKLAKLYKVPLARIDHFELEQEEMAATPVVSAARKPKPPAPQRTPIPKARVAEERMPKSVHQAVAAVARIAVAPDPRQQLLPFELWAYEGQAMLGPLTTELEELDAQLMPLETRYKEMQRRRTELVGRKSAIEAALTALGQSL